MKPEEFDPISKVEVKYQQMPETWFERLPTPEEIWTGISKSETSVWKSSTRNGFMQRNHGPWCLSTNFPEIFVEMMKRVLGEDMSFFVGQNENCSGSLSWHVDGYHVWAFNIEGETEWEWFDIIEGKLKKQNITPGNILTMPMGVTHRVKVLSDTRTSASIVTRYGAGHPTVKPDN